MKTLLKIGAIVILLIVVALVVISSSVSSIIKAGVESVGPTITGTTVKLDGMDLSMFSGKGRLRGLVVGNPPGFHTGSSFKLADAKVRIDLKSALSDKLIIEEILIDGPAITYEGGPSGSNISKIQENVAAFAKSVAPKDSAGSQPQKKDPTQRKVQINDFIFKNGKVTMSATILKGQALTIPLPDIHLRAIGKESGGVTPETAAAEVFKAINKAVVQSVTKGAGEAVKSVGKGVGEAAKSVGSEAGKAGSEALEGVKGLFGK